MSTLAIRHDVLEEIKAAHQFQSDAEMARAIGISAALISHIKSGRRGVGASFILGMHQRLGVPFDTSEDGLYEVIA